MSETYNSLRAVGLLNRAVKDGKIVKPSNCQKCCRKVTTKNLHAHHFDYAQPYNVVWLCALCHRRVTCFLMRMQLCLRWLEHCDKAGIEPGTGVLPVVSASGKVQKITQFEKWKKSQL